MKDMDIIRSSLPATERIIRSLTRYQHEVELPPLETPFCEFDAERLESAAKLIRQRLKDDLLAALEDSEDEMNENLLRFGI